MAPDTAVTVTYHRDGYREGRPAINVKSYEPWGQAEYDLASALDSVQRAEGYLETAFEQVAERFWADAAIMADTLGLGPIEQEGRSGGWLVLTDGRDPQTMMDTWREYADVQRREWLAAYANLADWCQSELAAIPQRIANLAQQLAMDEIGRESGLRAFATFGAGYYRITTGIRP